MTARISSGMLARFAAMTLAWVVLASLVPVAASAAGPAPRRQVRSTEARALERAREDVAALADADSDIPGAVALAGLSGVVAGTLNASSDADDVYKVTLAAGDVLFATVTGPANTQFDLWLYAPTATGIYSSSPVWFSNADDVSFKYPVEIELGAELPLRMAAYGKNKGDILPAGTYYLDVWAGIGSGAYTLSWQIVRPVDTDAANADIPGAVPTRPQVDWVSDLWDSDDVFRVDLQEGDQLDVALTSGDRNLAADVFLFRPTAASVMTDYFTAWSAIESDAYPSTFSYVVPKGGAGTYYIDAYSIAWSGSYTLNYAVTPDPAIVRLWGANRFDTAQAVTRSSFAEATCAVLATGMGYADALSAAGLAGAFDAPLLLVNRDSLPDAVAWELLSLGVEKVFIVGGSGAVSANVERTLNGSYGWFGGHLSFSVERIAGPNRYVTAALVADRVVRSTEATSAFLVRGDNFADALAVSPLAYTQGMPILLTPPRAFDAYARAFIENRDIKRVFIAGGTGAVSGAVENAARTLNGGTTVVHRIAGFNRYDTSARVAGFASAQGWNDFGFVAVATGANFPDALAGGVGAGNWGGVLLLTAPGKLTAECAAAIGQHLAENPKVAVLGGPGAVSAVVYNGLGALVR